MFLVQRAEGARLSDTASGAPFFANSFVVHTTGRLRRHYFELMVITDGTGRLVNELSDGEPLVHPLRPGTMILFRPTDLARFVTSDPEGLATLYVSFSEPDWETFAGLVGLEPTWVTTAMPPTALFDPGDPAVLGPFQTAVERFRDHPTSLDLVRFLSSVVPVLFDSYGRPEAGRGAPDWLRDGLDAMRADENLRLGVPRLLELAHVSPSYLSATVRRYFGSTPTAMVREMQLRRAALLLSTTGESVRSIAARCGFENVTYFSTCFRRFHHLSPREYRSRAHGGGLSAP